MVSWLTRVINKAYGQSQPAEDLGWFKQHWKELAFAAIGGTVVIGGTVAAVKHFRKKNSPQLVKQGMF